MFEYMFSERIDDTVHRSNAERIIVAWILLIFITFSSFGNCENHEYNNYGNKQ